MTVAGSAVRPVVLYRPVASAQARRRHPGPAPGFVPNHATAADNAFSATCRPERSGRGHVAAGAGRDGRRRRGAALPAYCVHVFGTPTTRPDSVFPNNWLSTHAGGYVAVTRCTRQPPSRAPGRRAGDAEVGLPLPDIDRRLLRPRARRHLPRGHRRDGPRPRLAGRLPWPSATAPTPVLGRFCNDFNYRPMAFRAVDADGVPGLPPTSWGASAPTWRCSPST